MRYITPLLSATGEFVSVRTAGMWLKSKKGSYKVLTKLSKHHDVWKAIDETGRPVVIKRALPHLMRIEREILGIVRNDSCIRQMIDTIESPDSMVLEYLDDNLLDVTIRKRLEKSSDVKLVVRTVLEALAVLHENGFVHTDVKPDNILINYSKDTNRFSKVALGDCGDVFRFNPNAGLRDECHPIGANLFRSPEAQLNLAWSTPTDIWSLGATLISLMAGGNWHICQPRGVPFDDENYGFLIVVEQLRHFGPWPFRFRDLAEFERLQVCVAANQFIEQESKLLPFSRSADKEWTPPDRDFVNKMMKLDPRDRPTAKELLKDEWFNEGSCEGASLEADADDPQSEKELRISVAA